MIGATPRLLVRRENRYSCKKFKLKVPPALDWLITMPFVVFTGILFRATALQNALQVFEYAKVD